jgi:hypothetical protein
MWGGRWDASNSSCILPGDPCPQCIYGPDATECIAKPASGTGCTTGQGFNGTYNDAGLCVATIPPGARTPCLSVRSEAGTVSITANGTLCQIAPTPDTPLGVFQDIAPRTYCSNGKDSGAFTDKIECQVEQRPGGLSIIPDGTRGSPRNDISALQAVSRQTKKKTWIPGVATAVAVVVVALVLAFLAKKCGWFAWCARKQRQRHQPPAFGPGEGILEETTYEPQPTYPSVGNQPYRDYSPATHGAPTATGTRMSAVSDGTTDPFSESTYNTVQWPQAQAHSQQLSPPGSPNAHIVNEPLLAGYPSNPPAYPADAHGYSNSQSPFR